MAQGVKQYWTEETLQLLREAYQSSRSPVKQLLQLPQFTDMSRQAIWYKAKQLGCAKSNLVTWTEEIDNLIFDTYNKSNRPLKILENHPLTRHIKIHTLKKHAAKIGVNRTRYVRFSPIEVETIVKNLELKKPPEIVTILKKKGFNRTVGSIRQFIHRNGWRIQTDTYTAKDVAIALQVSAKTVARWIRDGKLKARQVTKGDGSYLIRPLNLAQFIVADPFLFEGNRVDVPFLVSILLEFSSQLK